MKWEEKKENGKIKKENEKIKEKENGEKTGNER